MEKKFRNYFDLIIIFSIVIAFFLIISFLFYIYLPKKKIDYSEYSHGYQNDFFIKINKLKFLTEEKFKNRDYILLLGHSTCAVGVDTDILNLYFEKKKIKNLFFFNFCQENDRSVYLQYKIIEILERLNIRKPKKIFFMIPLSLLNIVNSNLENERIEFYENINSFKLTQSSKNYLPVYINLFLIFLKKINFEYNRFLNTLIFPSLNELFHHWHFHKIHESGHMTELVSLIENIEIRNLISQRLEVIHNIIFSSLEKRIFRKWDSKLKINSNYLWYSIPIKNEYLTKYFKYYQDSYDFLNLSGWKIFESRIEIEDDYFLDPLHYNQYYKKEISEKIAEEIFNYQLLN